MGRMAVSTPAATTIACQTRDEDVDQKDVGQDAGRLLYHVSRTTKMSIKRMAVRTPAAGTIAC